MTEVANSFVSAMDNFSKLSYTENGAIQLTTSNNAQIDMFFNTMRTTPKDRLYLMINNILGNDYQNLPKATLSDLFVQIFHLRATRGMGKGERNQFVLSITYLYTFFPKIVLELVEIIPFYGSFKDLLEIAVSENTHRELKLKCLEVFAEQLKNDINQLQKQNPKLSFAGKWAPREGHSYDKKGNKITKTLAKLLFPQDKEYLKKYRQSCTKLNKKLNVPEVSMSAKKWAEINFKNVPSVCLDRHNKAFLNELINENSSKDSPNGNRYPDDDDRIKCRNNLINSLVNNNINAKELFPHEVIRKFVGYSCIQNSITDELLCKAQWKIIKDNLKKSLNENKNITIGNLVPLVDVSGSMNGEPMQVAIALGLLISELTNKHFQNRVITFESTPKWHILNKDYSIVERVRSLIEAPWGGSTDIMKALDLIYDVVEKLKLPIEQVPDMIVFTDMQFDQADDNSSFKTHYELIKEKFEELGKKISGKPYNPPRIIFWNLRGNSYSGIHAPVQHNTEGVQLLSGFSPSLMKSLLDGDELVVEEEVEDQVVNVTKVRKKVSPWDTYRKIIDADVFDPIRERIYSLKN
jgi:hypothetical protein